MENLIQAIESGNHEVVERLLGKGANAKAFGINETHLHWAAGNGYQVVVKYLIEKGDDVNACDNDGDTPLHWAVGNGHQATVVCLVERGADVNCHNKFGQTPLHWAAAAGHQTTVVCLIERGADVNCHNKFGQTPLHWAAAAGHQAVVACLVERGADINARDKTIQTPLHCGVTKGHQAVVACLVERGADINACDKSRQTPLHWAIAKRHQKIVACLLEKGADVSIRGKKRRTSLYLAILCGRASIIQLLLAQGFYCNRDFKNEQALALCVKNWKSKASMNEEEILCGIAILLAGIPVHDDALPERLQKVKARIYKGVEQCLNPINLAPETLPICIPAVLRALPQVMHLAQAYKKSKQPTIDSNYDTDALKQCFFIPQDKLVGKDDLSILEGLQKPEHRFAVELIIDIRECMVDKEAVKIVMEVHQLETRLVDYLWQQSKLHFAKRTQPLQPPDPVEGDDVLMLMKLWDTQLGCILKKIPQILKHQKTETLQEHISAPRP